MNSEGDTFSDQERFKLSHSTAREGFISAARQAFLRPRKDLGKI